VLPRRAVTDERGLDGLVSLTPEAEDALVRLAAGNCSAAQTHGEKGSETRYED
jgi:putative ATPase